MALSDLQVFSEHAYSAMTEVQDQAVQKFNGASQGTIVLRSAAHQGDFSETAIWKKIPNLVRRRNVYGSATLSTQAMQHLLDTSVKVAAGTNPVDISPAYLKWIQRDPKEAGVVLGRQLAEDSVADMLNVGLLATRVALSGVAAVTHDISAGSGGAELASLAALTTAAGKFGDRSQAIRAWIMHSTPQTQLYLQALGNSNNLFEFGNVRVVQDGHGRVFVVTDSPSLVTVTGTSPNEVTKYHTLGLVNGGVIVDQNGDFTDNVDGRNGNENIQRTYQAEWSYNVGMQGFAWDKANGGKSPNNAALGAAGNWDRYATSHKDLAGVVLISK